MLSSGIPKGHTPPIKERYNSLEKRATDIFFLNFTQMRMPAPIAAGDLLDEERVANHLEVADNKLLPQKSPTKSKRALLRAKEP